MYFSSFHALVTSWVDFCFLLLNIIMIFYVGYPGSGFAYFPLRFTHKGNQNRIKRDQDRTRRALSNALFTFPLMPPPHPKPKKNPKYYQKITKKCYTFCKCHHDSSIEGIKTLNTHRPIELEEIYRMHYLLFLSRPRKPQKNPKYY